MRLKLTILKTIQRYKMSAIQTSKSSHVIGKMLNKVPEVTLAFWVIKIMSTTVGETVADFLAVNIGWGQGITGLVMGVLLTIALFW